MIVVMQLEATESDVEGVTEALARHGLVTSVSRGRECTLVGAIGDVDAAGDLSHIAALAGVERTMRVSAPYKLVRRGRGIPAPPSRSVPGPSGGAAFALIAGPCAIESREQAAEAWAGAAAAGATVLRGDLYKHRTSPYAFQGLGPAGLEILAEQKSRLGCQWSSRSSTPRRWRWWPTWSTSSGSEPGTYRTSTCSEPAR